MLAQQCRKMKTLRSGMPRDGIWCAHEMGEGMMTLSLPCASIDFVGLQNWRSGMGTCSTAADDDIFCIMI
jgi:hypothetical protein